MEEKKKRKRIIRTSIIIIAILVLAMIVMLNIRYEVTISRYEEHTEIQNRGILKLLLSAAISIGLVLGIEKMNQYNFSKKIKIVAMVIAISLYVLFQIVWIQHCNLKAGADSEMIYGGALRIFQNRGVSDRMLEYFSYYKQNIGLTVLFEGIMQLLQNGNLNLFRYLNVIANIGIVFGLYAIYKIITENEEKKNGLLFFTLILGFLPISLLSTWVYGDFIGLALGIWSIVFMMKYVKNKKIQNFIFSSIAMSLAIMTRSNSLIFIIAMAIYLLFTIREEKTSKEKTIRLVCIGVFIIISLLPNKLLENYISNQYGLNDRKEKSTMLYLYMGMSEGKLANGWYNDEVAILNEKRMKADKEDQTIENEIKEKLKERVKYLLQNPSYTIEFYKGKILSMWAEPTMASEIYNTQRGKDPSENKMFVAIMEGNHFEILKVSQKIIDGMIYVGTFIYVILKRKDMSHETLLLILVFLGGFSFHMLWEAKSRYIIPYVVILIPVAVKGITEAMEWLKNKTKKKMIQGTEK